MPHHTASVSTQYLADIHNAYALCENLSLVPTLIQEII